MTSVANNLATIQAKVEKACHRIDRSPDDVNIVAVTKYVSVERTKEAYEAGIKHLAENRDEGFIQKIQALGTEPTWHFIGSLQSRKVKMVIDSIDMLHSLDRLSLAKEIQKRSTRVVPCFLQVKTTDEATKHGLAIHELDAFVKALAEMDKISIVGVMTMAPVGGDEEAIRRSFRLAREIKESIQQKNLPYAPCNELSMGMSGDFELAIEEGSTYIRIGSSLVGEKA
ncbi:YggS family pyridoxal phosphate-dependent enzyme [Bacillus fonticola]|uniref:YggS family pyridoxal phosphate-dependent enzyme n=1 Tax=Bacillus fonticola TaxID=2728853 RepID=UPI0014739C54|nr:YggS family pyridoxal phosphate-dependent enzyme [Bacillus fonticola]